MRLILVAFFIGLVSVAVANIGKLWRNETTYGRTAPDWWSFGVSVWRGWVQATTALVVGGVLILVGGAPAFILSRDVEDAGLRVPLWYAVPYFVVLGVWLIVVLTIILFNAPKSLVPPHLRREAGLIYGHEQDVSGS